MASDSDCREGETKNGKLDKNLWSDLPEDLVERVLVGLPIQSLLRLQIVCKKWENMISSHYFRSRVKSLQSHPSRNPWFALFNRGEASSSFSMYNPHLAKSTSTSLSFVPCTQVVAMACAGGLICLTGFGPPHRDWSHFLYNPITRKWKRLPPVDQYSRVPVLHIAVDYKYCTNGGSTVQYTVITGRGRTLQIYDSSTRQWTVSYLQSQAAPAGLFICRESSTLCNDKLYISSLKLPSIPVSDLGSICHFDLQTNTWSKIMKLGNDSRRLYYKRLVACQGRLLMIGGGMNGGIQLWEIDEKIMKITKEISRTPKELFPARICGRHSHKRNYIYGIGHGLLVCCWMNSNTQMVVFDLSTASWHSLSWPHWDGNTFIDCYPFDPNFVDIFD